MNHILIIFFVSTLSVFAQLAEDEIQWEAAANRLPKEEKEAYIRKITQQITSFSKKEIQILKGSAFLQSQYGSSKRDNEIVFFIKGKDSESDFILAYNRKTGKLKGYNDLGAEARAEKQHRAKFIKPEDYQHDCQTASKKAIAMIKKNEGIDVTDKTKWRIVTDRDSRQLSVLFWPTFRGHRLMVGFYRVEFSDIENLKVCRYTNAFDCPLPEYKEVPNVIPQEKAIELGKKFLGRKGFSVEDKPIRYELLVKRPSGWFTEVPEKYSRDDNWRDKKPIWVWQVVFRRLPSKVFVNWNNIPIQVDVDAITGKVVGGAD